VAEFAWFFSAVEKCINNLGHNRFSAGVSPLDEHVFASRTAQAAASGITGIAND
jgi:hypothetical protein